MLNIKSSLLVLFMAGTLALSVPATERYADPVDMVVADSLNVRSSPAIEAANVVGMLGIGNEIQVLGESKDSEGTTWCLFLYNGEECYVSKEFLTPKEKEETSEETTEAATQEAPARSSMELMELMELGGINEGNGEEEPQEVTAEEPQEETTEAPVEMEPAPPQETEEEVTEAPAEEKPAKVSLKKGKTVKAPEEAETEDEVGEEDEGEASGESKKSKKTQSEGEVSTQEEKDKVPTPTAVPLVEEPATEGTTAYVRQTSTYENGEVAGPMEEKTIVKTEDVPNLKAKGHGYVFTTYSNGSVEVMVY